MTTLDVAMEGLIMGTERVTTEAPERGDECEAECRRQSLIVAKADQSDLDLQQFLDDALADVYGLID